MPSDATPIKSAKIVDKSIPDPVREKTNKNLVPFNEMTPQQRREVAMKGAKKSAEARAYNRSFKAAVEWALALPAMKGNPSVEKIRKQFPGLTNQDALVISVMAEGIIKGDVKSLIALRDTVGETPSQSLKLNAEPMKIEIETVD